MRPDGQGLNRRAAMKASAAAAGVALLNATAIGEASADTNVIDTLVFLEDYPFRHLKLNRASELAAHLRQAGVSQAWAGTFGGLLHKDIAGANERLTATCRREGEGLFMPFGAVNPTLPDWEEDVRRCHEVHRMRGVRLHPNYHGYALADPRLTKLLEACMRRRLVVQIALWMDDERHVYLRLPKETPELTPLAIAAERFPELQVVVYGNAQLAEAASVAWLLKWPNVSFGLHLASGSESTAIARRFTERLVFGSWAPLEDVTSEAKHLRSAGLGADELADVLSGRARRLVH